jgi:RNA exonuclease 1
LEKRWQMTETPAQVLPGHRRVVAIDCEMGHASDGESELIRLTAVDYFSGKTLIDTLVYPDIPMQHFNTRWSGVTRSQMENARRRRQCLFGTAASRTAVFQFVGRNTIVVGHGLSQDLLSLRWCHGYIVDSYLIESNIREARLKAEAEKEKKIDRAAQPRDAGQAEETKETKGAKTGGKGHPDGMSLKALAMKKLGRSIQGGKGHDSLEDAVAARDLVHSYVVDMLTPSVS